MGHDIRIRFYEELNAFLPPERRKRRFTAQLKQRTSVKDLIESLGVPHTEVDLILVNGVSVGFDHRVGDRDDVSVYPVFERFDIGAVSRVRPEPLRRPAFVADVHLGRLAAYLRMLGFDTLYRNDYDDAELAAISIEQHRILLTRDRKLLMRGGIRHGCYVHTRLPRHQLLELCQRLDLFRSFRPFSRCMHCNGTLAPVAKAEVDPLLLPRTRRYYQDFWRCRDCAKVYWKGTHFRRMQALLEEVRAAPRRTP